jgi:Protein of unknown function (DUF4012)
VLVALVVFDAVRMYRHLRAGEHQLSHLQLSVLDSDAAVRATIGSADHHLHEASAIAHHSPWLNALRHLPILGPQVDGTRQLSEDAARVGDITLGAASRAHQVLNRPRDVPAQRLRMLDGLRDVLADSDSRLAAVHPARARNLVGPFLRARNHFISRLASAHTQLSDAARFTTELRSFLAGPRTYLVLGGNNAEMRGGGITTAASLVHVNQGDLQVGHFIESADLFLPDNKRVSVPPNLASMFGWMSIGQEWRTTDTSPNWPQVAEIYARMSAQSSFGPVDGVLFVDVVTLKSLLQAVGPVTVDGIRYTGDNVEQELLYKNYLRYPSTAELNSRHDQQGVIAAAIFDALRTRSLPISSLAHELSQAVKGRHLLAWSAISDDQDLWTKVGATGQILPFGMLVSPQNVSANKLDYFIRPKVAMTVKRRDTFRQVDMTVTMTNPPRSPTSPVIEGGQPGYEQPGDHRVYLLLYLPSGAYDVGNSYPGFVTVGSDGGMKVVGMIYTTALGKTTNINVSFRLPLSWSSVVLLPSGRLNPIEVTVNNAHYTDAVPVLLPL